MKRVYILLSAMFFTSMVIAQGRGGKDFDPKVRAEQQTERMAKELSLTEAQKTKVLELNLAQAESRSAAMKQSSDNREAAKTAMEAQRAEYEKNLKGILTTEQYATYTKNQAERFSKSNGNKSKK